MEELCVSEPDRVLAVHTAYIEAGAGLIRTNSFGANAARLAEYGLERRVSEVNWTAAQLARDLAKDARVMVAGSVGPLGEPRADRRELFLEQIGALLDGGVRTIILETFTDLRELEAALEAKHTLHHCPVIACVTLNEAMTLPDGTALTEAFRQMRDAGADVVGVNCTPLAESLVSAITGADSDQPMAVFGSAGLPADIDGRFAYPISPDAFAAAGVAMAGQGVRLIGGCCGAGPAHIAALTLALRRAGFISAS